MSAGEIDIPEDSAMYRRRRRTLLPVFALLAMITISAELAGCGVPSNTPTPTPTATGQASGIPANIDYEPGGYGDFEQQALTDPRIGAVDINMNWNAVEPTPPTNGVHHYVWGPADAEVQDWAAAGKKVVLVVRYAADQEASCDGTQMMPQWELQRIPTFCDAQYGTVIPNYFDPTFISDLQTYIWAIGTHFGASSTKSSILYVRVGLGLVGESFPVWHMRSNVQGWAQLQAWGYSPAKWEAWQEARLAFINRVFSYTTVIYPVNDQEANDPATGLPLQAAVAYWAAARGIGIGQQGLVPDYTYARIDVICAQVRQRWPSTYIEFQTVGPVSDRVEVLGDIETAQRYGARFIEWYARDAVNASFQPLFQQWQSTVTAKFGT